MIATEWLTLQEAIDFVNASGGADPQETLRRHVAAAKLVRPGRQPQSASSGTSLRVRVTTEREIVGMDWLQSPELNIGRSEIMCRGYLPGTWEEIQHPRQLYPAKIAIWANDARHLWPAITSSASRIPGDDELVEEARRMMQSGLSKHAAASAVAPRAKGNSVEASIKRITRKLDKRAAETSNEMSKKV